MITAKTMIRVEEMEEKEIHTLLRRVGYGHLGLVNDTHPYVVPINYAYVDPDIYIFTTEGHKTEIIENNPEVCLQVEDVADKNNWQSVIVLGDAVQLTNKEEIKRAMDFILATNPKLTPALSIRWMDQWIRSNIEIIYRITPTMITGRTTLAPRNLKE